MTAALPDECYMRVCSGSTELLRYTERPQCTAAVLSALELAGAGPGVLFAPDGITAVQRCTPVNRLVPGEYTFREHHHGGDGLPGRALRLLHSMWHAALPAIAIVLYTLAARQAPNSTRMLEHRKQQLELSERGVCAMEAVAAAMPKGMEALCGLAGDWASYRQSDVPRALATLEDIADDTAAYMRLQHWPGGRSMDERRRGREAKLRGAAATETAKAEIATAETAKSTEDVAAAANTVAAAQQKASQQR